MQLNFIVLLGIVTSTVSQVCDHQNSVVLTNRSFNGLTYKDGEYFVDETGEERGCICMKETCARKCCSFGQGYDEDNLKCANLSIEFNPPVWERSKIREGFNIVKEFYFFLSKMKCFGKNEERIFISYVADEYYLNTDGTLHVELTGSLQSHFEFGPDKYCMDNFITEGRTKLDALVCLETEEENNKSVLNSGCMLVSCFFIILTVAVYSLLPDLRNTIPGMVMIAYLTCFFFSFLVMATMQISIYMQSLTRSSCLGMAFVIYFSTLAAFFWLNVMFYDIWRTFRNVNVITHGASIEKRVRFLWYSAYAFGVPTALTVVLAALELSDNHKYNKFLPNLRRQGCFLDGMGRLIYFYTPMLLVCVANLVFFALAAKKIAETKKQTQRLQKKDTQWFSLYLKLFVVTGCNWILEAISAYYPSTDVLWQFTDAYNFLVGLVIFIIFVCKKKTFNDIKQSFQAFRGASQPNPQGNASVGSPQLPASVTPSELSLQSQETVMMKSHTSLQNMTENTE